METEYIDNNEFYIEKTDKKCYNNLNKNSKEEYFMTKKPNEEEVKAIWRGFQEIQENASDAIQLLSMSFEVNEQRKKSLRNKTDAIRNGLAALESVLDNF